MVTKDASLCLLPSGVGIYTDRVTDREDICQYLEQFYPYGNKSYKDIGLDLHAYVGIVDGKIESVKFRGRFSSTITMKGFEGMFSSMPIEPSINNSYTLY
jgi:hypothetical protein